MPGRIGLLSAVLAARQRAPSLVLPVTTVAHFGYHWLFALALAVTAMALLGRACCLAFHSPRPSSASVGLTAVLCTMLLAIRRPQLEAGVGPDL